MDNNETNTAMVVFHKADPDGWCSAYLAYKKLLENYKEYNILCVPYNHGNENSSKWNTSELFEAFDEVDEVIIVDCTLPDNIMEDIAYKTTWIDHHKSIIEEKKEWKSKLLHNYSRVTFPDSEKQISAVELTYLSLYPSQEIPKFITLVGRYDVFDLSEEVLDFNATMRYSCPSAFMKNSYELNFEFILFCDSCIKNEDSLRARLNTGSKIRKWQKFFDDDYAEKHIQKASIHGRNCLVSNRAGISSLIYEPLLDGRIENMINFYYNVYKRAWTVSIYTPVEKDSMALELMKELVEKNPKNVLTYGGHERACGCTCLDIQEFLLDELDDFDYYQFNFSI